MKHHFFMRFSEGRKKALTLSYDDGVEQDIRLMEILDKYGLKCTFNINSGRFAPEGTVFSEGTIHRRMTRSQATELYTNSGHEVAVHGTVHPWLETLPTPSVVLDIINDRKELEEQFGTIIRGMAYPYGTYSDSVVEALRACGIAYSRTTIQTERFDIPTDWLRLPTTCRHKNPRLMELAKKFAESDPRRAQLFYLWGHSYEFEEDDNWNVIEEFAEYMGGRDDIWYATNIEIYDYIDAYNKLMFSADGHTIYNPTLYTICFASGGSSSEFIEYSIAPGQTIHI
ncbi:MAG: polysaccharide deacetylase [Ruminococcaceae bacterium]|nr:polysaccharide deacetylase [Oscillospiraceae bacterium]